MKKAFSLLELIFAIVVIGIIASFAIPKYIDTRDSALASTIKRDLITVITSVQSYYLINNKIEKISDAVSLNESNWKIDDKKLVFNDKKEECLSLELKESSIIITIDPSKGRVCKILDEMGVKNETFDLI
ncbi:type II secretion system protein [Halarcobacter bivalviorum]|uniref:Prepilin-type cleavage/methylation domain-containing protein n=1 Tax=Halarcobacter bivalviorum TaxID=663364 RepID=A0AAX2AB49_9BACT|nr:prepilin-type N-terminal cleavage/methylation domain-containing protein [Halarcobacter bivalviorum]AXH12771.1 type II secretion/transformation system, G protein [Halarcobacter bivalviorum]RXK10313.1 prepilin-type cleavage/methylation domain-containing protein [Halarcobacter bivalviorum]